MPARAASPAPAETGRSTTSHAIEYGPPVKLCDLAIDALTESSGLAASRIQPDIFWTHNDSGGQPNLYAFDAGGRLRCTYRVNGANARDWEDMASFTLDGQPWLLIADVGDNRRKRTECQIYLVREPTLPDATAQPDDGTPMTKTVPVERVIRFKFDQGPRDCESVAFDPTSRQILLTTKRWSLTSQVYQLEWAEKRNASAANIQTARSIGRIPVPVATAMDVSPDGRRAVVVCYGNAYEFTRGPNETWMMAFSRKPREIRLPARRQGEALCFGHDGRSLFLTSERQPTPFFRVPPKH